MDSAERSTKLHIVSWNVASWVTTLQQIRTYHGSLRNWADRHQIDILCLQEVKGTESKLEKDPAAFGALEPGFDAFFALSKQNSSSTSSSGKTGFNGIATFARKGLTVAANAKPLDDEELDKQGRCLETDHGEFLLYNIYAPNDGNSCENLPSKMRFFIKLRERIIRARRCEANRKVIIAGDFNARYRLLDCSNDILIVNVERLVSSSPSINEPLIVRRVRKALVDGGFAAIKESLKSLQLQPFGDRGKFRVLAPHPRTKEMKRINPLQTLWSREQVDTFRPFQKLVVDGGISVKETFGFAHYMHSSGYAVSEIDDDDNVYWIARVSGSVLFEYFKILTQELLDVVWESGDVDLFCSYSLGGWLTCGKPCTSAFLEWLISEGELKDSFVELNGEARNRFTVWSQYTNERYSNLGARIDFILVDRKLDLASNLIPLYGCKCSSMEECKAADFTCANSDAAALLAATAYGRWKPAPFQGGGLPVGTKEDYATQFRSIPHTGILYTPPTFSDHVACSCILTNLPARVNDKLLELQKNPETNATRTFAKQSSILGFFQPKKPKMSESL